MAVKIRLMRLGKKKKPVYRLVVADERTPRDGRTLDIVGFYDPNQTPAYFECKDESIKEWVSKGAQLTDVSRRLLSKKGLVEAAVKKSSQQNVSRKDRKKES